MKNPNEIIQTQSKTWRSGFMGFVLGVAGAIGAIGAAHAGDLKILHINDHHSHLKADGRMGLDLAGSSTRVRSGGMPAVVAKFKALEQRSSQLTEFSHFIQQLT